MVSREIDGVLYMQADTFAKFESQRKRMGAFEDVSSQVNIEKDTDRYKSALDHKNLAGSFKKAVEGFLDFKTPNWSGERPDDPIDPELPSLQNEVITGLVIPFLINNDPIFNQLPSDISIVHLSLEKRVIDENQLVGLLSHNGKGTGEPALPLDPSMQNIGSNQSFLVAPRAQKLTLETTVITNALESGTGTAFLRAIQKAAPISPGITADTFSDVKQEISPLIDSIQRIRVNSNAQVEHALSQIVIAKDASVGDVGLAIQQTLSSSAKFNHYLTASGEQLIGGIERLGAASKVQYKIQLLPNTLGVIIIEIERSERGLKLVVQTATMEAQQALNHEISKVGEMLKNAGFIGEAPEVRHNPLLDTSQRQDKLGQGFFLADDTRQNQFSPRGESSSGTNIYDEKNSSNGFENPDLEQAVKHRTGIYL